MAFCPKCGSQINESATFCGSCGAQVAGATGTPASAPPGSSPPAAGSVMSSNVAAMLAYLPFVGWIIAIVFLVIEPYKNDRFVRFHAFQSLFFGIACFVIYWVLSMIFVPVAWGVGFSFFWMLWGVIRLAMFVAWIFLLYKAYKNEKFMLPVIGPLAAKQAG
jgi:uncharacterized membrane protein